MMPVGLILTMPFTGKLLDHFKSRTITMLIGTLMYNLVLACLGFQRIYLGAGYFPVFFRQLQKFNEPFDQCAGHWGADFICAIDYEFFSTPFGVWRALLAPRSGTSWFPSM